MGSSVVANLAIDRLLYLVRGRIGGTPGSYGSLSRHEEPGMRITVLLFTLLLVFAVAAAPLSVYTNVRKNIWHQRRALSEDSIEGQVESVAWCRRVKSLARLTSCPFSVCLP